MIAQQELPFDEAAARDEAIDRVLEKAGDDWRELATGIVRSMAQLEVTGEDIRLACLAEGVGPHHHNAWGGLINQLIRDGVLHPTGRYTPMRARGSHARKTQIYTRSA